MGINDKTTGKGDMGSDLNRGGAGSTDKQKPMTGGTTGGTSGATRTPGTDKNKTPGQGTSEQSKK